MLKPEMPNMPGIGSMTDAFDFMKKMWGGMDAAGTGLPGMAMPTLSVEKINKQIADLKAVEAWLNVNMNMLRATIQTLEVQSATLAGLQAMGQNFAASMKQDAAAPAPDRDAADGSSNRSRKEETHESGIGPKEEFKTERKSSSRSRRPASPPPSADTAGLAASMADPAAWWNMLQSQFNQAVGSAMPNQPEPEPPKASAGRKRKTQSKTQPKTQPRSGGQGR